MLIFFQHGLGFLSTLIHRIPNISRRVYSAIRFYVYHDFLYRFFPDPFAIRVKQLVSNLARQHYAPPVPVSLHQLTQPSC